MSNKEPDDPSEEIDFWGGWKGLYIFIVIYAVLQIVLLLVFTISYSRA